MYETQRQHEDKPTKLHSENKIAMLLKIYLCGEHFKDRPIAQYSKIEVSLFNLRSKKYKMTHCTLLLLYRKPLDCYVLNMKITSFDFYLLLTRYHIIFYIVHTVFSRIKESGPF